MLTDNYMSEKYMPAPSSFENPFISVSNKWLPTTMRETFQLCEWTYRYGMVKSAFDRAARIFYTELVVDSHEETTNYEKLEEFLRDKKQEFITIMIDYMVYGNVFLIIHLPFHRHIICPTCNGVYNAKDISDLYFTEELLFNGTCPKCKVAVNFSCKELPDKNLDNIQFIRIPPQEVEIIKNKFTGEATYFWDVSPEDRGKIKNGKGSILISSTPKELLEVCFSPNKKLKFNDKQLLHLRCNNLSGLNIEYGMPVAISCFPMIFYISVLRKANEAIGMDYILPLRLLFPGGNMAVNDPGVMNNAMFVEKINEILLRHKIDPLEWNITPFQIGYQVIGGEKRSLMISDEIKMCTEELLSTVGFTPGLFYGSEMLQATPMSLRMLENTWGLTDIYNQILKWAIPQICAHVGMAHIKILMEQFRYIDDMERRNFIMQALAAQQISAITAFNMYGLKYKKEREQMIEEEKIIADLLEKRQKDQQLKQQMSSQQQGQGGTPGSGSPQDIMQQAEAEAQQLLTMSESDRRMRLNDLINMNPLYHAAVKSSMERARNKLRTQGMNAMLQQGQI